MLCLQSVKGKKTLNHRHGYLWRQKVTLDSFVKWAFFQFESDNLWHLNLPLGENSKSFSILKLCRLNPVNVSQHSFSARKVQVRAEEVKWFLINSEWAQIGYHKCTSSTINPYSMLSILLYFPVYIPAWPVVCLCIHYIARTINTKSCSVVNYGWIFTQIYPSGVIFCFCSEKQNRVYIGE